jgi:hypothetical protein
VLLVLFLVPLDMTLNKCDFNLYYTCMFAVARALFNFNGHCGTVFSVRQQGFPLIGQHFLLSSVKVNVSSDVTY